MNMKTQYEKIRDQVWFEKKEDIFIRRAKQKAKGWIKKLKQIDALIAKEKKL